VISSSKSSKFKCLNSDTPYWHTLLGGESGINLMLELILPLPAPAKLGRNSKGFIAGARARETSIIKSLEIISRTLNFE
jgi:hypothetical protein